MSKPNLPVYGVVNGLNPLEVLKPQFLVKSLQQNVVYANVLNTLTARISTNFDLDSGSSITIQGLTGAQTLDTELDLTSTGQSLGIKAQWLQDSGSLVLTVPVSSMVIASNEYVVEYNLTNPAFDKRSPVVEISARIDDGNGMVVGFIAPVKATKPHSTFLGIMNGSDPFQIVLPRFEIKSIEQSTPFAAVVNTLTLSLKANCDVLTDSSITVFGLTGSTSINASLDLITINGGISSQGTLTFNERLVLTSLGMKSNDIYEIRFNLTNPVDAQSSPAVSIRASVKSVYGDVSPVVSTAMVKKGQELFGVANGSNPLEVLVPVFEVKTIEQSTPLAAVINTITVSLKANCDLLPGSTVTIHGLTGSAEPTGSLWVVRGNGGLADKADWDISGNLTLTSAQHMQRRETYEARFNLSNPRKDQSSPLVMVRASVKSVYGDVSPVVSTAMVRKELELLGVANGSNPLEVLVPVFEVKTIEQSTPLAAVINTITVSLKANCDLLPGSTVTIHGLTGSAEPTGSLWVVRGNGGLADKADWDISGNLTLTSAQHMQRRETYEARFNLSNPRKDQSSPLVMVRASVKSVYGDVSPVVSTAMVRKELELLGVANGSNPLEVLVPVFEVKTIEQSTPLAAVINTITVSLKANCDLLPGSTVALAGMIGVSTYDGTINLQLLPLEIQSRSFMSTGIWQQEPGNLTLTSLGTKRRETHTIVFNITNQNKDQESPSISTTIRAKSVFGDISESVQILEKPSADLLGVRQGKDPLKLLKPDFITKEISQSHPVPLSSNMISILLQTNCDFAVGSVITIAGLIGSNTPDETGISVVGGYYDDWFDQTITIWLQTPGVLKLQVPTFFYRLTILPCTPFCEAHSKHFIPTDIWGLLSTMSKSMFC
jgi:hypothetical protein